MRPSGSSIPNVRQLLEASSLRSKLRRGQKTSVSSRWALTKTRTWIWTCRLSVGGLWMNSGSTRLCSTCPWFECQNMPHPLKLRARLGTRKMVSPPFHAATVCAHSNLNQSVHSPDTVTPRPLPRVDSSPLKRKAVEHVDLTQEGPGEPAPASKRLRLRPATTVSPHYRHSSFYFLTDSRLHLRLAFA